MSTFLRIDINLIAFVMLGIIFILAKNRLEANDSFNYAYLKIVPIILVQLILEASSCIINKIEERYLVYASYLIHICLFITGAALAYRGYILIHKLMIPNQEISKLYVFLYKVPLFINTVLTLLSFKFGFIFFITNENVYHRGEYFIVAVVICYFYILSGLVVILKNKSKIGASEFTLLIIFCLLPIVGGILQSIFYGALLMWSSTAFALVIMYSYLQQRMVHLDYLTGVWSRGSFEFYIKKRLMDEDSEKLGVIYCDIDGLKEINDENGHLEGDLAIKNSTKIIKNSIRKTDIIVRMGGDEFIILVECEKPEFLHVTLEQINKNFLEYNKTSQKDYILSCSFGCDMLQSDYDTIEQFIHHVDTLMYENKKAKKEKIGT